MQTAPSHNLLLILTLGLLAGISNASNGIGPSSTIQTLSFSKEVSYSGLFTSSTVSIKKAFFDNSSKRLTTFSSVDSSGDKSVFSQYDEYGVKQWDVGYPISLKRQCVDINSQYILGGTYDPSLIDFLILNTTDGTQLKYFRMASLQRARAGTIAESSNSFYVVAKFANNVIVIGEVEISTLFSSSTGISLTSEGRYDLGLLPTTANVLVTYRKPNNLNYISKVDLTTRSIIWTNRFTCISLDCTTDNDSSMIVKSDYFFLLTQVKSKMIFMKANHTDGSLIEGVYVGTDTSSSPLVNTFTECGSSIFISEVRTSETFLHVYNQETSSFSSSKKGNFIILDIICLEITQTSNEGYSVSNNLFLVGQTSDGVKGIIKRLKIGEEDFDTSFAFVDSTETIIIDTSGFVTYDPVTDVESTRSPSGPSLLSPLISISVTSSDSSTFSSCIDLIEPSVTSNELTISIGKTKNIPLQLGGLSYSSPTSNLCGTIAGTNCNALSHAIEAYQAYSIPSFASIDSTDGVLSLNGITLPAGVKSEQFKFQIRTIDSTSKYSLFIVTITVTNCYVENGETCSDTSLYQCKQGEEGFLKSKLADEGYKKSYSQTLSQIQEYMMYIVVISSFGGLIALGSNPFGIWTIINTYQQYLLIILLGVYLPGELLAFFLGQQLFLLNFNFLPFEEILEK